MNLIESLEDERISKIEAEWNSALNGQKEETRLVAQVVTYLLKCLRASLTREAALRERAEAAEAQLCRAREAILMTRYEIIELDPEREPMGSNWPYKVIDGVMAAVRQKAALSSSSPCRHAAIAERAKDVEGMAKAIYGHSTMLNWDQADPDEKLGWLDDTRAIVAWILEGK